MKGLDLEIYEKLNMNEKVDFECKAVKGDLPGSVWDLAEEVYSRISKCL